MIIAPKNLDIEAKGVQTYFWYVIGDLLAASSE